MSKKIFLVAGEPSGDLHASKLAAELKRLDPGVSLAGVGGKNMSSAGVSLFRDSSQLAIIGLQDILRHFGKIRELFRSVIAEITERHFDLVILVDYPGFNLRLARELKKHGIKIIYFVSPQVWAWGSGRVKTIRECVQKILVFFKFEEDLYKKSGVPVEFVGHPLLDSVNSAADGKALTEMLHLDRSKKTVLLLPGSRMREVTSLLPTMTMASQKLYEKFQDIQFIVVKLHSLGEELYKSRLGHLKAPYSLVENADGLLYECMAISDLALVASGTATLECAIMGLPMVITYKVSLLSAFVMKSFMRISTIGLVNILAGKKVVPELVQFDFTAGNVFKEASKILSDKNESARIKAELSEIKKSLGEKGASRRAALSVLAS